jgi:hypothetical protein
MQTSKLQMRHDSCVLRGELPFCANGKRMHLGAVADVAGSFRAAQEPRPKTRVIRKLAGRRPYEVPTTQQKFSHRMDNFT